MILLTFQFFFICLSIDKNQQPQIFLEELKKIDELEKKLNETLDLLFEYVKKREKSINNSTSKDFENKIEELIKRTEQIANKSKTTSNISLTRIPLSIDRIIYSKIKQPKGIQFDYRGFFVPGDNPEIKYKPAMTQNNRPQGLIFQHLLNHPCEAKHLNFTFISNSKVNSIHEILLSQNNTIYYIDDTDDFDRLDVKVLLKSGESSITCIPDFILFSKDEQN